MTSTSNEKTVAKGPYVVGKNYFFRLVTYHVTGKLKAVYEHEIVLTDAAWIADDGRFAQAMQSGNFAEVEPLPAGKDWIIGRWAIVDGGVVDWPLPRLQK